MNTYSLPTSITVGDNDRKIRNDADYRVILAVMEILRDDELSDYERIFLSLKTFYADGENAFKSSQVQEAYERMCEFIDMCNYVEGATISKAEKKPISDFVQDFNLYVGAVNAVIGYDIRCDKTTHWFSFVAAYKEIDSKCTYSTILSIRDKIVHGEKLDKWESKYRHDNPWLFELRIWYTKDEWAFLHGED